MKIDYKQKIVLFYGNILCVNADAAYISADRDGEIFAHNASYTTKKSLIPHPP